MIISYLPESAILARLKQYEILLNTNCRNRENILNFYYECKNELERRHGLYMV